MDRLDEGMGGFEVTGIEIDRRGQSECELHESAIRSSSRSAVSSRTAPTWSAIGPVGEVVRVEGAQPGLAQAGGEHHQAGGVPGVARGLQRCERLALQGRGLRRRLERLGLGIGRRNPNQPRATRPVAGQPLRRHRLGPRVAEERLERGVHLCEAEAVGRGDEPVVPLDAVFERGFGEVRRAHVGGAPLASVAKDVALRMEAGGPRGDEHAQLERARGVQLREIEQAQERVGVGDVEVVTGDHAEVAAAGEQVLQRGLDAVDAAAHDEGDGDVGGHRAANVLLEQRQERLDASRREPRLAGLGLREVVALAGDDVANPAARIGHVAAIARDEVHVQVHHRLPGHLARVDPEVVALGRGRARIEGALAHLDQVEDRGLFVAGGFPPGGHLAPGNDQRVPGRDREAIPDGERELVCAEPVGLGDREKRRRHRPSATRQPGRRARLHGHLTPNNDVRSNKPLTCCGATTHHQQ